MRTSDITIFTLSTTNEDWTDERWQQAYDKAYIAKWWVLLSCRSILLLAALVVSFLVLCYHKRRECFFIVCLSLITVSVSVQLYITAIYFTGTRDEFKQFVYTDYYRISYVVYIAAQVLFRWIFATQYTQTSLALPFQFEIGRVRLA